MEALTKASSIAQPILGAVQSFMPVASAGLDYYGGQQRAQGYIEQANANAGLYDYRAAQYEQIAGQELAASQFSAEEKRRQTNILLSKAQAIAAANGGGALDPTSLHLMAGVVKEGELAAQVASYQGKEKARNLLLKARGERYSGSVLRKEGQSKAKASLYETAISSAKKIDLPGLVSAGSSLLSKFSPTGEPFNGGNPSAFKDFAKYPKYAGENLR